MENIKKHEESYRSIEQIRETIKIVYGEYISKEKNLLGKGLTAEVFVSDHDDDFCYKIMKRMKFEDKTAKSVEEEGSIMTNLRVNTPYEGVKIPTVAFTSTLNVKESEEDKGIDQKILCMERVMGPDLRDITMKDAPMPEYFKDRKNVRIFFNKVWKFIREMHKQQITHRDLHLGNVMIEEETGTPYVIDFGFSHDVSMEEFDYRKLFFDSDIEKFRDNQRIFEEFIIANT